jgi:GNAT superfamily N-acetyltransferase
MDVRYLEVDKHSNYSKELQKMIRINWSLPKETDIIIRTSAVFVVLVNKSKLIGGLILEHRNNCNYISYLLVSKEYRNKRIGANLIDISAKHTIDGGKKILKLHAETWNNSSRKFYESHEFMYDHSSNEEDCVVKYIRYL